MLEDIISGNSDTELFLLPEMSFTGFSMNTASTADHDEETLKLIKKIASQHHVSIGFGWVRAAADKCENVYTIVDPVGTVVSEYVKIHPFSYSNEDKFFVGGNQIITYKIGGISFSTFICYDLRFPELFRRVCKDVHAVIIPANWPAKRSDHWKTLLRARAIENQVYIFAVNCFGEINGISYSGDSCIIDPNGDIIADLSNKAGIIKYEFFDDTDRFRKSFPVLDDIKNEISIQYNS